MSDHGRRKLNASDDDLKNHHSRGAKGHNQTNEEDDSGGGNDFYANLVQRSPNLMREDQNAGDTETTNSDYEKSLIIKKKKQQSSIEHLPGTQSLRPALKKNINKQNNTISDLRQGQSHTKVNQFEHEKIGDFYRGDGIHQKQKRTSNAGHQRLRVSSSENSNMKFETKLLKKSPSEYVVLSGEQKGSGYVSKREVKFDFWTVLMTWMSYFFLVITMPFSLFTCIKISQEFERAVIFRLGRVLEGDEKGPGIFFVLPCIDSYTKVDLRTVTFDVPPQEILTKDSVTVSVDAVVYFRIFSAVVSVINVEDAAKSTKLLAASTLRNILGTKSLHEILSDRESIAISIQSALDDATEPWGVKVERVEVKDVRLPVQLQRAMAAEAEATREARAKVIAAEGENKASKALRSAAEVISQSPIAIQLRYLQTLTQIASERNSTIVFPVPLEMLSFLRNTKSTDNKQNS